MYSVLAVRADKLLKGLNHARLDHSYEAELRKLLAVDVLVVDDFGLDAMDATESRDVDEILTERDRAGSMIITSNRGPDEWLATFADPVRAQASIDRFTSNAYHLVYRGRVVPEAPQAEASWLQGWTEEGRIRQLIGVMRRQETRGDGFEKAGSLAAESRHSVIRNPESPLAHPGSLDGDQTL